MARYRVYLETSEEALDEGGYLGHVPSLPGCVGRGETKEAALQAVRSAIEADLARAGAAGLPAPKADEPIELDVTETADPTLPPDYAPLTDGAYEETLLRAMSSRQALLDLLSALPEAALDWRARESDWPMRWILSHIATADLWYASRLEADSASDLGWRLDATRSLLLDRLREVPEDGRDRVTSLGGERWTPRKVARRMLEHEREHLLQLQEMLQAYLRESS